MRRPPWHSGAHAADVEQAHTRHVEAGLPHSRFEDIEQWLRVWDDPQRDAWTEPERVIDLLRLRPGMRLAFLGAATGFFNARLARAVGPSGVVYAADADSELVRLMRERAGREATPNVHPVLAAEGDPQLPVPTVDRVLLVDTYHHLRSRRAYYSRLKRWLPADGLLLVVEWLPGELGRGPSPAFKITPEKVSEELRAAGYRLVERTELRYQYVLVFRPALPEGRP